MNKFLLVLGAVVALSSTATFAQSNGISIGIEGGPNRSSFWGNDFIKQQKSLEKPTYFSAGVSLEYGFTELLSLRTGLGYERKGVKTEVQQMDQYGNKRETTTGRSTYEYLILPFLAKVKLGNDPIFFLNAGPYLGYLLKETDVVEASDLYPSSSVDGTENNKRLDLGITTGIGAGLPVTEKMLMTLELRYNLGLYNISAVPVYNDGAVRTKSTNLLLGIAYKIKG